MTKLTFVDTFRFLPLQFQGDRDLHPGENEVARGIAEAGREWSLTHWRREDMVRSFSRRALPSPLSKLTLFIRSLLLRLPTCSGSTSNGLGSSQTIRQTQSTSSKTTQTILDLVSLPALPLFPLSLFSMPSPPFSSLHILIHSFVLYHYLTLSHFALLFPSLSFLGLVSSLLIPASSGAFLFVSPTR